MATKFLLALDAGHGLPTPGRRIPANLDPSQHQEWWLNQRICNYIAEAAKQYEGLDTIRVDDTTGAEDVGMSVRCQRANAASADLYYSAHHNAGHYCRRLAGRLVCGHCGRWRAGRKPLQP